MVYKYYTTIIYNYYIKIRDLDGQDWRMHVTEFLPFLFPDGIMYFIRLFIGKRKNIK